MGLGKLLVRPAAAAPAEARSVQYTATDTVTGQSQSWMVVDGLAPSWSTSATSYGVGPKVPGAWRASLLLSGLLGQVPWDAYRKLGRDLPETRVWPKPMLLDQPAPPDTRMTTFSSMALDLIYHGNAIALVAARAPGTPWPTAIVPVSATAVGVRRVGRYDNSPLPVGALEYSVGDLRGLSSQDVIHVKGPCPPGALRGMGVLECHMETLNLAAEQSRQARAISSHGVPTGVLKTDNPDLDDDEAADLKAKWHANQSSRSVAVLNASTTFQPLSWNPEELQLVEARKFTLTELELIFGLPVGWLGGQTSSRTYSNIEQDAVNLIKFSLSDHVARFEQTLSLAQPRGTTTRANLDGVLRADTLTRYQAHAIALANGFMTVDEVREVEHREPLPAMDEDATPPPASPREVAEMIQKVYLGVGKVVTWEEARGVLRAAGMPIDLAVPAPAAVGP